MAISRSVRLRMRNVLDKIEDKIKTHFIFSKFTRKWRCFLRSRGKNIVQPGRTQMTKIQGEWATDTHSHFILLIAFPRQQ